MFPFSSGIIRIAPKISQQGALLARSSAVGKLGKIKTFTAKGLIKIFSDRLSSCNYSHLKMRLQTRVSWLTLKFCFWLFFFFLINFEWKRRSQASDNSLFLSFFPPFMMVIAPRVCGFSSGLNWEKNNLKSVRINRGFHAFPCLRVFETGLVFKGWLYDSAGLTGSRRLTNLGAKLADREAGSSRCQGKRAEVANRTVKHLLP